MIEWLTGSSRPAGAQYASGDDGATFLDEAPETPAPLFAVRAFKTAIFGTPRITAYQARRIEGQQLRQQELKENESKVGPEPAKTTPQKDVGPTKTPMLNHEKLAPSEFSSDLKSDQLMSPTKGILLTPGTAATRRKTVSFSARKEFRERTKSPDKAVELESKELPTESISRHPSSEPQRKQSALTRTLIEMSTTRSSSSAIAESTRLNPQSQSTEPNEDGINPKACKIFEPAMDVTVDLSQPRSRSGQHWKATYEEYQKNSTREMKKIIQCGQNVKSYATKKDLEATSLGEKLQRELANVARIESKISKLAKQLKATNARGPHGESEQARLVGELAQQSAMTLRYQKKAERYRKAKGRQSVNDMTGKENHVLYENAIEDKEEPQDLFEVATTQAQLESMQEITAAAEDRAVKLEIENKQLKRNLARVKEEMMSYESRRQAREERLKKREGRHKDSKEQCETELADLKAELQKLLQASQAHEKVPQQPALPVRNPVLDQALQPSRILGNPIEDVARPPATAQTQRRQSSLSPRKKRSHNPAVDIWTPGSPYDNLKQPLPNNETIELGPSSAKHNIDRALNEINQNLAILEPDPPSQPAADPKSSTYAEIVLPINKSFIQRDMDDFKGVPISRQLHLSTVCRSGSLVSHRVSSRTNTMGSARTSSLSADRAAAAKARLAERKKSGEKKNKKRNRIDSLEQGDVF